ncbi:MAG: hypothetical protein JXR89_11510 [Deltaproteobacteria bacterium]|nr:hypothetical protein [Deltaproteobacteria bacterium]
MKTKPMSLPRSEASPSPILTETMAQLLLDQRHWREAVEIYEKLGQQNPSRKPDYQKKIIEIKDCFEPRLKATPQRQQQTLKQIKQLRNLLRVIKKQTQTDGINQ